MVDDYGSNRAWADKFIRQGQRVLGMVLAPYIIEVAPPEEDMKRNTDLRFYRSTDHDIRMASRVRRPWLQKVWPNQVTLRCELASGSPTEVHKILAGWGHAFLYAISNDAEDDFWSWHVFNLGKLRRFYAGFDKTGKWTRLDFVAWSQANGLTSCNTRVNDDLGSAFVHFDIPQLVEVIPGVLMERFGPQIVPRKPKLKNPGQLSLFKETDQ